MKQKLFTNIKRLTSVFSIAILLITVTILLLRLTVFSNSEEASKGSATSSAVSSDGTLEGVKGVEFKYSISNEIRFKNFKETANPRIKNDSSNTALMQVKIIDDESKASLYESVYIKPGVSESAIKLSGTPLEKGVYKCKAEIIVLDPISMKELTKMIEDVDIIIDESLPQEEESSTPSSDTVSEE